MGEAEKFWAEKFGREQLVLVLVLVILIESRTGKAREILGSWCLHSAFSIFQYSFSISSDLNSQCHTYCLAHFQPAPPRFKPPVKPIRLQAQRAGTASAGGISHR
jgi:hypothetical protein